MNLYRVALTTVFLLIAIIFSGCEFSEFLDEFPRKVPSIFAFNVDDKVEKPLSMPPNCMKSPEPLPDKFYMDVYWDTTISMQGFTRLSAGNVYRQLPDILSDFGNSFKDSEVHFYRFGEKIVPVDDREHLQFRNPDVYSDLITSFGNVIDEANPSHLSVVVTDLFESNADWSNVTQKCREKFFSQHLSIAIIGIKNSFNGEIFDVGINAANFSYDSGNDPVRFRPCYLFLMGAESQVRAFLEKWKKVDASSNEIQYVVFSEYCSLPSDFLRVSNAKAIDKKNLLENRTLLKSEEQLQEVVIVDYTEKVSLKIPFKFSFNSEDKNCLLSENAFDKRARIFVWNDEGEWQVQDDKQDNLRLALTDLNDETENNHLLELSFNPQSTLLPGRINLIQVQVIPEKNKLSLPEWISDWDMGNIDIAPEQFNGAKTVNLKKITDSLKDSLFAQTLPIITELNLVIDERKK